MLVNSKIAVISDGGVQELGTHNELISEAGIYANLCRSQGISATQESGLKGPSTSSPISKWLFQGSDDAREVDGVKNTSVEIEAKGSADDIEAALVEDPSQKEEVEGEEEEAASLSRLWEYNKAEWAYIFLGFLGGIIVGALPPCEGILFGKLTSNLFALDPDTLRKQNLVLSLSFFALAGGSLLGNMALGLGFSVSGFRLARRMRVKVFEKIVRHSMGWFDFPQNSTGELTTTLEEDAEAVSNVTGWQLGQMVQVFSSLSSGIVISLAFSWQIGLIALGW